MYYDVFTLSGTGITTGTGTGTRTMGNNGSHGSFTLHVTGMGTAMAGQGPGLEKWV